MADVMGRVNVKITDEFTNSSSLGQAVDLKATNPRDYAEILRDVQKQVNDSLTQLVELRSAAAAENIASDDEEDGEESDSSEPSKKRKILRPENPNKKNKV